jgi:predicted metal-dependent hydrolase
VLVDSFNELRDLKDGFHCDIVPAIIVIACHGSIVFMVSYQVRRNKRAKGLRMAVSHQGIVIVSAPPLYPKKLIDRFVIQNETWAKRQQKKIKHAVVNDPLLLWDERVVSFKGKLYRFVYAPEQTEKVMVNAGSIMICPVTGLESDLKKTLLSWLKLESQRHIQNRLTLLAQKMNVTYTAVRFRQQRSRWGSCSSNGSLSFNWRLIHFSEEIIDYVLVHELAHLRHMNHSKSFWNMVSTYDKDYRRKVAFLRRQIIAIE